MVNSLFHYVTISLFHYVTISLFQHVTISPNKYPMGYGRIRKMTLELS